MGDFFPGKVSNALLVIFIVLVLSLFVIPIFDPVFSPFEATVTIGDDDGTSGTTTTTGSDGSSSGPSGGSDGGEIANFLVDKDLIEVQMFPGETKIETIVIQNVGDLELLFDLSLTGLSDFAGLSENSFLITPGNSKSIMIDFLVGEDEQAAIRTGSISVKGGSITRLVNIILQILETGVLFDLNSELKDETLSRQQQIEATITMIDISGSGEVEVFLEYFIIDFEDNAIKIGEETLQVDGSLEIERAFEISEDFKLGDYVFSVVLTSQNKVATSANAFKIIDVLIFYRLILFIIIVALILVFLFLIFYYRRKEGEEEERKWRKGGASLVKGGEKENRNYKQRQN